jgi:hypothetical protein
MPAYAALFFYVMVISICSCCLRIGISYSSIQTPAPTALLQWSESEVEKEAERNDKKTARECIRDSRVGLYGFHVRADIDFLICPSSSSSPLFSTFLLLLLIRLSPLSFSLYVLLSYSLCGSLWLFCLFLCGLLLEEVSAFCVDIQENPSIYFYHIEI